MTQASTSAQRPRWRPLALACALTLQGVLASAAPSVFPTGVTRHDPSKAHNSYVLFSGQDKKTHLIDMSGQEVHQWAQEGSPPVLLDPALTGGSKGRVLLQLPAATLPDGKPGPSPGVGELDWEGQVKWRWLGAGSQQLYAGPDLNAAAGAASRQWRQHHDWQRLSNGNTLLLVNEVRSVPGFSARELLDDALLEVSPAGEVLWVWRAADHYLEIGFTPESLALLRQGKNRNDAPGPFDYLHANSARVLGPNRWHDVGDRRFHPDNVIVSLREANTLVIVDRRSGRIAWRLGPDYPAATPNTPVPKPVDQILGQHDAHLIAKGLPGEGNVLVFDNQGEAGYPRVGPGTQPRSRVLEIDPLTRQIVWQYTAADSGRPGWTFYSSFISSARRLPNGNTLIDEGMNGRLFQVTPKGEIVWEYVSPYFGETRTGGGGQLVQSNHVYRAQPVPYDWVPDGTPRTEKAVTTPALNAFKVPSPSP
jgi:Arylsulfotransferase (ASST)